ncbi:hypothetical protein, partial [Tessaracoccus sp.]|uniref:hypothetical protein n=1 Tax=Tessaracoccus sp. TaxID=1971211 RepID=UPI00261D6B75
MEIMERLAAESRVAVEVVRATEEALPYDQRSTVELAVLKALQDLGAAGLGAAYTPDTNSVRVTAWTNDPASIRQRVDELNAKGDGRGSPSSSSPPTRRLLAPWAPRSNCTPQRPRRGWPGGWVWPRRG